MLAPKQGLANAARPLTDFVPYSTHVSTQNVRTVGGDTLTVIKLAGIAHEAAEDSDIQGWHDALTGCCGISRRKMSRCGCIPSANRARAIRKATFEDGFAGRLNERYRASLAGVQLMANTHYLTLLVRGKSRGKKLLAFGEKRTQATVLE